MQQVAAATAESRSGAEFRHLTLNPQAPNAPATIGYTCRVMAGSMVRTVPCRQHSLPYAAAEAGGRFAFAATGPGLPVGTTWVWLCLEIMQACWRKKIAISQDWGAAQDAPHKVVLARRGVGMKRHPPADRAVARPRAFSSANALPAPSCPSRWLR